MCGSSGSRLDVISSTGSTHYGNAPTASVDSLHRRLCNSVSGQSLLDLVGCKLGMSRHTRHHQHQQTYQHEGYYSSSRDSIAYINR
nr:unnamed protein product [Callosobruchus chinensis]